MTPQSKMTLVAAALALSLGASGSALAVQQGDILVRAGVAYVSPTGESDELTSIAAGAKIEADNAASLGITLAYMATDNIGVGLLAAWPFSHDIEAKGSIAGLGTVAETDHLPPTVTLQYHFMPSNSIRPFVGAGVNYTTFFNTDTKGALEGVGLNLDSSWGLAAEAGVDIDINSDWFVSAQVWYIDINTDAKLGNGIGTYEVEIDPWVGMIGIGTKF